METIKLKVPPPVTTETACGIREALLGSKEAVPPSRRQLSAILSRSSCKRSCEVLAAEEPLTHFEAAARNGEAASAALNGEAASAALNGETAAPPDDEDDAMDDARLIRISIRDQTNSVVPEKTVPEHSCLVRAPSDPPPLNASPPNSSMRKASVRKGSVRKASLQLDAKSVAPPTKRFQYFLSHKKSHSQLGFVPAQMAKNFHDSLELLGHKGWFDLDNLSQISKEQLQKAVSESASMIVILNDETALSEWCQYEWTVANDFQVPVKVVVDMETFSKKQAIATLGTHHAHMLQYQLLEYTDRYRRDTLAELSSFLREVAPMDKHGKLRRPKRSNRAHSDPLAFGHEDDDQQQDALHSLYEQYTLAGGAPIRPPTTPPSTWVVGASRASCIACCATWLLLCLNPDSPIFIDYHVEVVAALWMVAIPWLSVKMTKCLRSEGMMKAMEMVEQKETGEELAKSIYRNSGRAAALGFRLAAIFQFLVCMISIGMFTEPWFWQNWWKHILALWSLFTFCILFGMVVMSALSGASQHGLILSISRIQLFTAFDALDAKIAHLGLKRYANVATDTLEVSHEEMVDFERRWVDGVATFQLVQQELFSPQCVWLGFCILACSAPLDLWWRNTPVSSSWITVGKLVWTIVGTGFFLVDILRAGRQVTKGLQELEAATKKLVFSRQMDRVYLSTIISHDTDLTCYIAGLIPCTAGWTNFTLMLIVASFTPLFFLNYV